ncbi:hypothetical protein T03_17183 [Trichinella britovi]|uniref:Uncharacterized protein n=1 Tax=Trichinella britovi TaxID=45882 RepID=A0A0V1C3R2_TRIBR|nr:hypothetical protein T03_17183 [Trichinella britovi]
MNITGGIKDNVGVVRQLCQYYFTNEFSNNHNVIVEMKQRNDQITQCRTLVPYLNSTKCP